MKISTEIGSAAQLVGEEKADKGSLLQRQGLMPGIFRCSICADMTGEKGSWCRPPDHPLGVPSII